MFCIYLVILSCANHIRLSSFWYPLNAHPRIVAKPPPSNQVKKLQCFHALTYSEPARLNVFLCRFLISMFCIKQAYLYNRWLNAYTLYIIAWAIVFLLCHWLQISVVHGYVCSIMVLTTQRDIKLY